MDKKIELSFVEYRGVKYPYRTITIFGQTEIQVAGESLSTAMGFSHTELGNEDAQYLDNEFACYAPDDLLTSATDDELADWVETEIYNNEPEEPTGEMPLDWFDHYVDCCVTTADDDGSEYYYKGRKSRILVFDSDRHIFCIINGKTLNDPEFHVCGNPKWEYDDKALLNATYDAVEV